jgi:hypothetical protein
MNWIEFNEEQMPEPKKLVWVKRNKGDVYLSFREDKPYSVDKELHRDCFWHGNQMPLGIKINEGESWKPHNAFCDKTVSHWAEVEAPKYNAVSV